MKNELLQKDLNKILEWSERLEIEFNAIKCQVMRMGKSCRRQTRNCIIGNE